VVVRLLKMRLILRSPGGELGGGLATIPLRPDNGMAPSTPALDSTPVQQVTGKEPRVSPREHLIERADYAATLEPLEYNPFMPEVHEDPYPLYDRLRREDPVHWNLPGVWICTRYPDVVGMLRNPRFSSDSRNSDLYQTFAESVDVDLGIFDQEGARSMLFVDPPDHTRLRAIVSKAFTSRAIEAMRPHVQSLVDELLDQAAATGTFDVVADLAYPLPVTVICEMLGVPLEDREVFRSWADDLVLLLDPMVTMDVLDIGNRAAIAFHEYFGRLVAERRRHPQPGLLTDLIEAEEHGQRLTENELIVTLILLLVAGHETTVNLISNGMLALLRHPDQMRRLRQDPSLIRTAVEEMLRFDSPVQLTGRTALEDMEIGGRPVRKRQQVVGVVGAANRDPAQFSDPNTFDIGREDNRHLAFGSGIHFCLGAPLARMEAQVSFLAIARRFDTLELATERLQWRDTITLRGLRALRVATR